MERACPFLIPSSVWHAVRAAAAHVAVMCTACVSSFYTLAARAPCVKMLARFLCKRMRIRTGTQILRSLVACNVMHSQHYRSLVRAYSLSLSLCITSRAQTRSSSANILMRCTESQPLRTSISSNAESPTAANKSLTALLPPAPARTPFRFLPLICRSLPLPRGTSSSTSSCCVSVSGNEYGGKGSGDGSEDRYRPGGEGDEYGAYRASSSHILSSCLTRLPTSFCCLRSVRGPHARS